MSEKIITQSKLKEEAQSEGIALRPYQEECLESIETAEAEGTKRQLVSLPTGTGKNVIFSSLARARNRRTLIKAHRDVLIEQAGSKRHDGHIRYKHLG